MRQITDLLLVVILVLVALFLGTKLFQGSGYSLIKHSDKKEEGLLSKRFDDLESLIKSQDKKTNEKIDGIQAEVNALKLKVANVEKNPNEQLVKSLNDLNSNVRSLSEEVAETCASKPPVVIYKKVAVEKKPVPPPPPPVVKQEEKPLPPPVQKEVVKEVVVEKVMVPVIPCEVSKEYFSCVAEKEKQWDATCLKTVKENVTSKVSSKSEVINSRMTIDESIIDYSITPEKQVNACSSTRDQVKTQCLELVCKSVSK